jgi:hypothetical protein
MVGMLLVFLTIFMLRCFLTKAFVQNYMDALNADSGQSDIMQVSELAYDYSLILKASIQGWQVADVEYIRSLALYTS